MVNIYTVSVFMLYLNMMITGNHHHHQHKTQQQQSIGVGFIHAYTAATTTTTKITSTKTIMTANRRQQYQYQNYYFPMNPLQQYNIRPTIVAVSNYRSSSSSSSLVIQSLTTTKNNQYYNSNNDNEMNKDDIGINDDIYSNNDDNVITTKATTTTTTILNNSTTINIITTMDQQQQQQSGLSVVSSTNTGTTTTTTTNDSNLKATTTTKRSSSSIVPSYQQLITFSFTTVLIWLSEPLLSLVDTTIIGQFATSSTTAVAAVGATAATATTSSSSLIQLASLGPATTYIDSLFYTTYFLCIATTNMIARNLAIGNVSKLYRTISHTITISSILGILCTIFTFLIGVPYLLPSMIGPSISTTATTTTAVVTTLSSTATTSSLLFYAQRYIYIRISVAIASIVGGTCQSILLATKDIRTPAIAVLVTSITNIIGDIALRQYGIQGAAIATAIANSISCSILFYSVYQQFSVWKQQATDQKQIGNINNNSPTSVQKKQSIQSSLLRPYRAIKSILSWPDPKSLIQILTLSGPIFFVIIAKVVCYGAMTVQCTKYGIEALATHSIMMRIFFFFGCFGDSLSQTAQSFVPGVILHNKKQQPQLGNGSSVNKVNGGTSTPALDMDKSNNNKSVKFTKSSSSSSTSSDMTLMIRRLLTIGIWIGVTNSQISTFIVRRCGHFVTKDVAITSLMRDHCTFMGLSLLVHPFIMLLEGIVLANRDYRTLLFTYASTMILHFTILSNFCHSFPAVWRTFFIFQCTRLSLYTFRVLKWWWSSIRSTDALIPLDDETNNGKAIGSLT